MFTNTQAWKEPFAGSAACPSASAAVLQVQMLLKQWRERPSSGPGADHHGGECGVVDRGETGCIDLYSLLLTKGACPDPIKGFSPNLIICAKPQQMNGVSAQPTAGMSSEPSKGSCPEPTMFMGP